MCNKKDILISAIFVLHQIDRYGAKKAQFYADFEMVTCFSKKNYKKANYKKKLKLGTIPFFQCCGSGFT